MDVIAFIILLTVGTAIGTVNHKEINRATGHPEDPTVVEKVVTVEKPCEAKPWWK